MRYVITAAAFVTFSLVLSAQTTPQQVSWVNALSWFLAWNNSEPISPNGVACQAFIVGRDKVGFDCVGVGRKIVAELGLNKAVCVVRFMRSAFLDELNTYRESITAQELADFRQCTGEIGVPMIVTAKDRRTPSQRWDERITREGRNKALKYARRTGLRGCTLHFPKIYSGDPFFHVYRECDGKIESVWEFPLAGDIPASYAHWTYTRQRGNLPPGSTTRLQQDSLWFAAIPETGAHQ